MLVVSAERLMAQDENQLEKDSIRKAARAGVPVQQHQHKLLTPA